MERQEFAESTLNILCDYVGEDNVFDALVRRWGIESLFDIVSALMEHHQKLMREQENIVSDGDE